MEIVTAANWSIVAGSALIAGLTLLVIVIVVAVLKRRWG